MQKRRWSKEEKLTILKEAKEKGIQVTLRKYGVYAATYYSSVKYSCTPPQSTNHTFEFYSWVETLI